MTNQKNTATTGNSDGLSGTFELNSGKTVIYRNGLLIKTESKSETTEYFYASDIPPTKLLKKVTTYQ